jgi:hypothetical protein
LLRLLIKDFYEVQTEVPVSDLPRRGDLVLIRRYAAGPPPFEGLWSHLTDWNVLEFKSPTDAAEEDDLDLLLHIGTGIALRLNEERRMGGAERLENRQVSFWFLAPTLGETFLGHARLRTHFQYQTDGLWSGRVWGHPVWLLAYRDAAVEEDTIPLHLLDREPGAPVSLGKVVLKREELLRRFAGWLYALQPGLWKEIRQMASTSKSDSIIDWEAVGEIANLEEVIPHLSPERVIAVLGVQRAIETIGLPRVIEAVGLARVIEAVGLARVIEAVGLARVIEAVGLPHLIEAVGLARVIEAVGLPNLIEATGEEKILDELLARITPEQLQEMLRRRQQK